MPPSQKPRRVASDAVETSPELPTPKRFADHYDRLVTPHLERLCVGYGNMIACQVTDLNEAYAAVWSEARKRGALFLSAALQQELEDWILETLLSSIAAPPQPGVLTPDQAFHLWKDIASHFIALGE